MGPELMLISAGLQAVGTLASAHAQSKAMKAQAKINEQNAKMAREAAYREEARQRRESQRKMGALMARVGKSGVTATGSILDVVEESALNSEMDALNIRLQGAQKAWGFDAQADADRSAASNAMTAGYISAASTLTSGGYDYYKATR